MKKLLFLLFLLPYGLYAQELPSLPTDATTGKFFVTETVEVPGLSQKDLHDKAQEYLTKSYKAPASTIQEDAAEKIVFQGFKKLTIKDEKINTTYPLHFVLTVTFNDGSYQYKVTDFSPDKINYYTPQSLKHPDQLKFKNKKEKQAYTTVYITYLEGMKGIGKDLQTGIKRSLLAKTPVKRR
ncbi:hypothetical protein AAE02nite_43250 [Adhaeribacter aerolatus]|uniref:DUF4468 domain-containing protein n=1 Tax=Adhaeribacter aerolatus TaxID=670289 RepID=A0A512B3X7_9BACT|nr:DUF4468 domain-containing protein [Adhaeribacter aerolatus]GEO06661.1 hypothetical protein AAE02nite_43250 [Adhaeribacter aerolatus]